jgi:hypothetical protein
MNSCDRCTLIVFDNGRAGGRFHKVDTVAAGFIAWIAFATVSDTESLCTAKEELRPDAALFESSSVKLIADELHTPYSQLRFFQNDQHTSSPTLAP